VPSCERCHAEFLSSRFGRPRKFCYGCSPELTRIRKPLSNQPCTNCGGIVQRRPGRGRPKGCCSDSCRRSGAGNIKRAKQLGREWERFNQIQIFERDGWLCALCHKPVDPSFSWPDRRSASLDHKIPLQLGGNHTRENSQCAHLGCNFAKGSILNRKNFRPGSSGEP